MFNVQHACYYKDGVDSRRLCGTVDIKVKEPTSRLLYIEDDDNNSVKLKDKQILELIDYLKKLYRGAFDLD